MSLDWFPQGWRQFAVFGPHGEYVSGTVNTFEGHLVPAPGAAALVVGLAVLMRWRR